ncbi:sensor histidine kinase [Paenarthrobacter sp. DKR-5]|uniref:sensor histidine kinase n=1 Tax=Paenarthrobacter sp. DKR-5 TaxID=2835535 RepID=UPI0027DE8D70|nr:sensor histidine kinase [Paenarthrobacter sp. DKR-5]
MDVGRTLLESPDADERSGFDAVARRARRESAATLAIIGVPTLGTDKLFCVAADGDGAQALLGRSLGVVPGALCTLRQDGKSIVMESPSAVIEDVENYVPPAPPDGDEPAVGRGATLLAALGRPGEGQGVLVLVRGPGADAFSQTEIGMSEVFGSHVALALELARAHRLREQQAVFGDRDRIARDLHDLVIQRLFAAGLSMQSLRRFTDDAVALDRIATVTGELDDTIRQLRDTIYSLRGTGSTETSLSSRILRVVQDNPTVHGAARLRFAGPIDVAVGDELAGHLLAVLTEGLSNAARHSQARSVEVSVSAGLGGVELEVVDDGVGFSTPSRRGGLATMSERAAICGGRMELQSSPGNGTRLSWFVPGPAEEAEEEQPPVRNAAPGRPSPRRPRPGSGAGNPASPASRTRSS